MKTRLAALLCVAFLSLPAWAQQLSAYFPGRYAVAALAEKLTDTSSLPQARAA